MVKKKDNNTGLALFWFGFILVLVILLSVYLDYRRDDEKVSSQSIPTCDITYRDIHYFGPCPSEQFIKETLGSIAVLDRITDTIRECERNSECSRAFAEIIKDNVQRETLLKEANRLIP